MAKAKASSCLMGMAMAAIGGLATAESEVLGTGIVSLPALRITHRQSYC